MPLATIDEALQAMRDGRMVILVDDEDRENEGDLCMAAEKVTPEAINFMAKHGRGLICLSLTDDRLNELEIPMMVRDNTSPFKTAFTVSIEARTGVTTGISAADRARTIQVAVADETRPWDLTRPGHIFPLRALPGGVLVRTGQTEGSVDLCRMAGLKPAGVICEVMREDGEMARLPELTAFAAEHDLLIVAVADLIKYRLERESQVERLVSAPLPSEYGDDFTIHVFRSLVDDSQHFAIVAGEPADSDEPTLVRVQHQCLSSDVFHSTACNCGSQLREALRRINAEKSGVVLYMYSPEHSRLDNILTHVLGHAESEKPRTEEQVNKPRADLRQFGVGAQILREVGVRKMRLMTTNPKKIIGLSGYGLEIVEQISPFGNSKTNGNNVIDLSRHSKK